MSRRFVARTRVQLETWQARALDDLAVAVLLLDGVHVGDHCLIVALAVTEDGTKHALGLWEGATENSLSAINARVIERFQATRRSEARVTAPSTWTLGAAQGSEAANSGGAWRTT